MKNFLPIACLTASLFATTSSIAENWPAWRGADGRAISQDRDLPLEWSTSTNIRWKTPLPAPANSTPIVWEAHVFITQAQDEGAIRSLICYDRPTGKKLWQYEVLYPHTESSHSQNPPCSGSPTTDGKLVYASFGSAGVVACNFSGQLVWSRDLGRLEHVFGLATTPVLYKNLLIIHRGPGEPTHIVALDKRTGETVWDTPEVGKNDKLYGSWSTPVIYRVGDRDEFVLSMPGEMKGYDPVSGKELWRCTGLGPSNYPDTAIGDNVLLGISGFRKSMMAVRMGGRGDITHTHRLWNVANTQQRVGSGVVHAGHLYVANATGIAECIDVRTGKTVWKNRLGGNLWGSILLAGDRLYVSSLEGDTFVLAANPEFDLFATNSLGEALYGALAASDGELFLRTYKHLYCIRQAK